MITCMLKDVKFYKDVEFEKSTIIVDLQSSLELIQLLLLKLEQMKPH